jgi:uncharacterized Zn finger protein
MVVEVEGFMFNDYCLQCQKTTVHKIVLEGKELLGACSSCGERRKLTEVKQVYYSNTDIWVTRFKVSNLPSVVAGKLLDAIRNGKRM